MLQAAWIAACVAAGCSVLSGIFGVPLLRWKLRQRQAAKALENAAAIEDASMNIYDEKARLQMMVSICHQLCMCVHMHACR